MKTVLYCENSVVVSCAASSGKLTSRKSFKERPSITTKDTTALCLDVYTPIKYSTWVHNSCNKSILWLLITYFVNTRLIKNHEGEVWKVKDIFAM